MKDIKVIIYIENTEIINEKLLSTVENLSAKFQITVILDGCSDKVVEAFQDTVPDGQSVRPEIHPNRLGFSVSCNEIIKEMNADSDVLIMTDRYCLDCSNLEEMARVLYLSEHNGAVVPRNNGGIFSRYPYTGCINEVPEDISVSKNCFNNTNNLLDDFTVIPYADTSVIMIKRNLLDNWGLFYELLKSPAAAIRAACEEINKPGFSTVMANHTFAEYYSKEQDPMEKDELTMISEFYGYIDKIAEAYEDNSDFYNTFSRILDPQYYRKKRILIVDMSAQFAKIKPSLSAYLAEKRSDLEVTFFNKGETTLKEQYHAGFIIMDHIDSDLLLAVNRSCMKFAVYFDQRLLSYSCLNTMEQAVEFKCLKMIYNTVDAVAFSDSDCMNELELLLGQDTDVLNCKKILELDSSVSICDIIDLLVKLPYDKNRVQKLFDVHRYVWKEMSNNNLLKNRMTELFVELVKTKQLL